MDGSSIRSWVGIALLVVAASVSTALWINRESVINSLYRHLSPYPKVRRLLRPVADRFLRDWPRYSGWPRGHYSAEWRIRELRRAGKPTFVVVGGVYMDLRLQPVTVSKLEDNEFYDLDTPSMTLGGSGLYFGRELHERARIRSYFYTRLGASEPITAMIKKESWIRGRRPRPDREGQCAISVHLIQNENDFYTTFTHTGALSSLGWSSIEHSINRHTPRGGVLYIAGYFRTGLHVDLRETLPRFSYKLLVCLEHGRFKAKTNQSADRALLAAFEEQLIDVYLCTATELCELMVAYGLVVDQANGPAAALRYFAQQRKPPPIVVVRSRAGDGTAVAHVLFKGQVTEVPGEGGLAPHGIGSKGRFNATFVHALIDGSPDEDAQHIVVSAAERAMRAWVGRIREEYDVSPR